MQHVNLYLPEFRPSRDPLRAVHMLWGLLGTFLLLLLVSFYAQTQHQHLSQQLIQAQQANDALTAQLKILTPQKPSQTTAEADVKIQQLQSALQRRQRILAMISSQNLGNSDGFSAQLRTLAQASLNTISLDAFSLQNGGTYAELSGKARSAEQIPLYLQKLREDPSFAHVRFGVLNMERDKESSGLMHFSLAKARPLSERNAAAAASRFGVHAVKVDHLSLTELGAQEKSKENKR